MLELIVTGRTDTDRPLVKIVRSPREARQLAQEWTHQGRTVTIDLYVDYKMVACNLSAGSLAD